ncbi:MAG: S-layer homology domain-containing protein [Candidatus Absconditabacterales bacterium]
MVKSFFSKLVGAGLIAMGLLGIYTQVSAYTTETGSVVTGSIVTGDTSTGIVVTGTVQVSTTGTVTQTGPTVTAIETALLNSASAGFGVSEDPEFIEALAWMYNNRITSLGTPSTYRPFDKITREEASKILSRFARNVIGMEYKSEVSNEMCIFPDNTLISNDLLNDVFESCKMGLFRGGTDGFYPKGSLSKAQSIVVLVRMFDNQSYPESSNPRFQAYYERAYELGITKDRDLTNFDGYVTRYEIALMIYRFNIKYKLLKQTSDTIQAPIEFISILQETIATSDGLRKANASVKTEFLSNESFAASIFGDNYRIKKRKIDNYGVGNTNFIRFGDLYTANEKTFLGSTSFTVINGFIEEAYIRPTELGNKYYVIKPIPQSPYYSVEEKLAE